ncbi:nuclear transport factor 2 family protein [Mycobacterium sp. M1]|uniref:Nuclear transport factor 2 family protein n=1 Tax=Mycolicibacter acidiphilus TaxID=2835306 RepID=A0ABS5RFP2_9MYCO|nr:nuclear transport factor 2 family protein [Mycolicibacter acidiphilus]MBS9533098.1 nuclear transport factor 2 family protein [Mycolicibacter acidiphilus]
MQLDHPAHVAGQRSRDAVTARDKEAWLAAFADDAIVEDPIGPSPFDPDGVGHRGKDAIAAFWDKAIAATDKIEFVFTDSFCCGNEEANIGAIVTTMAGHQITTDGVFTYRVNEQGQIIALRAYWELERAAKTARKL